MHAVSGFNAVLLVDGWERRHRVEVRCRFFIALWKWPAMARKGEGRGGCRSSFWPILLPLGGVGFLGREIGAFRQECWTSYRVFR